MPDPEIGGPTVEDLEFLLGTWEGHGTLRGMPLTSRTEASRVLGCFLQVDIACHMDDDLVHEERTVFFVDDRRGLAATSFSANGAVMHWDVRPGSRPGRWTLTRAPFDVEPDRSFLWKLYQLPDGSLREEFLVGRHRQDPELLVRLYHRKTEGR